jgi:hypothetical protein
VNNHSFQAATDLNSGLGNRIPTAKRAALRITLRLLIGAAGASLSVAPLVGTVAPEATAAEVVDHRSDQAKMAALFTGRFVDGVPVYQLPALAVVASRKAELAKIDRDESTKRIRQARARAATKPPA